MQWSADRNAGFSRANPQELYLPIVIDPEYHYEAVNVDAQQSSPSLLLWWMKRIIGLRKRHAAFGRGSMTFVDTDNRRVLAFLREYEGERLLVVANLSRFAQGVHLSLNSAAGEVPVELFGQGRFPPVTDAPYFLSLGPHGFFWFALEPVAEPMIVVGEGGAPTLRATGHWSTAFDARRRRPLEAALAAYAPSRRWFAGKSRHLRRLTVAEVVPLRRRGTTLANFVLLRAEYVEGEPELYAIILTAVTAERAAQLERDTPWALVCRVETEGEAEYLVDGLAVPEVASALLEWFRARRSFPANGQSLTFATVRSGRQLLGAADFDASPAVHRGEQNNTSLMFGNRLVLKFIRRVEYGPHPQVEVGLALGESPVAAHVPAVVGTLSFGTVPRHSATVAVLEEYVPHQCDAWTFAVDELTRFVEEVAADQADPPTIPRVSHPLDLDAPPQALVDRAGPWLDFARLLGQRTGELHLALAQRLHDPDFSPEPFTPFYQRALAQGFGLRVRQTMRLLRGEPPGISDATVALARTVARSEEQLLRRLRAVATRRLQGKRIRLHGDLRLGQVLVAGHDAIFIDFEGEPTRSLGDRRVKRSPFRDVVGMVRSFDDAAKTVLRSLDASIQAGTANIARVEAWIQAWDRWTAAVYVQSYLHTVTDSSDLLGRDTEEHHFLLDAFALDRALEQVRYELDNRPDRVEIPLREVAEFIDGDSDDS
jgi:maltose alpha-D-glucosyltransferase/alpha-amylase